MKRTWIWMKIKVNLLLLYSVLERQELKSPGFFLSCGDTFHLLGVGFGESD